MDTPPGWVLIADIATAPELTPDQRISLVAAALTELGIARALVMIHGWDRGARRYADLGGCVRFTSDGEPMLPVSAAGRH